MPKSMGDVAPGGIDWVARRFKAMEKRIRDLETARPLGWASANFDGSTAPPEVGTQGWALTRDGDAIISGALYLGEGIVGDNALENPIRGKVAHGQNQTFALHTGYEVKANVVVNVPAGFTSALVSATFVANARNNSGGLDYMEGYIAIEGYDSTGDLVSVADVPIGNSGQLTAAKAGKITDLGDAFGISGFLGTGFATWTSDGFNSAVIDALVLFLR